MFFFTGPDPPSPTAASPTLQPNVQSGLGQSLTDHSAVDKKHIYRKFSFKEIPVLHEKSFRSITKTHRWILAWLLLYLVYSFWWNIFSTYKTTMAKIRSDYIYSFSKTPVIFRSNYTLENLTENKFKTEMRSGSYNLPTSRAIPTSTYIYRNISSSSGIEDEIDLSSDITNRGNGKMHNQRTPKLKKSSQKKICYGIFCMHTFNIIAY